MLFRSAAKPEESGSETSPWQLSWKDDGAYTTWLTAMKERLTEGWLTGTESILQNSCKTEKNK